MPLRRQKKSRNLHHDSSNESTPRNPKRRRLSYSRLLTLPRELREIIYTFLFPNLSQPLYLCLGNDHRSPRNIYNTTLGPCNPYTTLRTALCLSNTCRQLRAEVQESYFRRQKFAVHICNLAPVRGQSHRVRWCLCAVALKRISRLNIRYTSLTIPDFEIFKCDGRVRVRFTESAREEARVLGRLGEERRGEYVRWRRWCAVVVERNVEGWVGRRGGGFGLREIRGVERGLKGVHGWCYRM